MEGSDSDERVSCMVIEYCIDVTYRMGPIVFSSHGIIHSTFVRMAGEHRVGYKVQFVC